MTPLNLKKTIANDNKLSSPDTDKLESSKNEILTDESKHIFVNSTGDDESNTGSVDSPYATLNKAFAETQDASETVTIHISEGTFL